MEESRRTRRAVVAIGALTSLGVAVGLAVAVAPSLGGTAPQTQAQTLSASVVLESKDVPLVNAALAGDDVRSLHPMVSRAERAALLDGQGVTFTVVVGGEIYEITTAAATLADALAQAGIQIGWEDEVAVDLSAPPLEGSEIRIGRASTGIVVETLTTEHEVQERQTSALLVGETRVVQEGADGVAKVTSSVRYIDGVEVSRSPLVTATVSEPVTEVIEVGTREPAPVVAASSGSSGGSGTPVGSATADTSGNRALGQQMMLDYGFAADQWSCLEALWTKESNWNHLAKNRSSGAYGIPQALPGSKMASAGADWETNPATQITWGLGYIAGRYGTPCDAWGAFLSKGWY